MNIKKYKVTGENQCNEKAGPAVPDRDGRTSGGAGQEQENAGGDGVIRL